MKGLILLLIALFVILLSYILYAGTAESLSATYYKVNKPYLFQLALGLTGFLMMIYLIDVTADDYMRMLDKIPEDVRTEVEKHIE